MATIDDLAKDFLAQKRIAVAGVSGQRNTTANLIYRTLKTKGYVVFGIGHPVGVIEGDPIYRDVQSFPAQVDGVVIVTRPAVADEIVKQCAAAGVRRVWMHDMLGTHPKFAKKMSQRVGSVSPDAVKLCREQGMDVIAGSCPMQFVGDFGHKCMGGLMRFIGALEA